MNKLEIRRVINGFIIEHPTDYSKKWVQEIIDTLDTLAG